MAPFPCSHDSPQNFKRVGSPSWEDIEHMRIGLNGTTPLMTTPLKIQIGGIEPVGVFLGNPQGSGVLRNAYPNPSNTAITFEMLLPRAGYARLRFYDLHGRLVAEILEEIASAGRHVSVWLGKDVHGRKVASGVYLYRLEAPGLKASGRVVLLR